MTAPADQWVLPQFPPGYDGMARLRPLAHPAVWDRATIKKVGQETRREAARDPLLFGLMYLAQNMVSERTGGITYSDLHLALYDRALRWRSREPDRSAWASHRGAAKSTTLLVLILWALANGYCSYALPMTYTRGQVKRYLRNLKVAIETSPWLLADFPEMRPGRPWTETDMVTVGGRRITGASLGETILGAREGAQRPDLVVLDDVDPGARDFTPASKAKVLYRIFSDVLPASSQSAKVMLTGTPTAPGSIMHDVVRAVKGRPGLLGDRGGWVRAAGFDPHWQPAILDAGTRWERSSWEPQWPLDVLRAKQDADRATFAVQFQCDPDDPAAAQWWTEELFQYDSRFMSDWRIISVDPAVTSGRATSGRGAADPSAIVVVAVRGSTPATMQVCVEHAEAGSWSIVEIQERIWRLAERWPTCSKTLLVETNQAGERWGEMLHPPDGVVLEMFSARGPKVGRIEVLLRDYHRKVVWHAGRLHAYETQLLAWKPGMSGHGVDDMIDAVRAAKDRALYGDASWAPQGAAR